LFSSRFLLKIEKYKGVILINSDGRGKEKRHFHLERRILSPSSQPGISKRKINSFDYMPWLCYKV